MPLSTKEIQKRMRDRLKQSGSSDIKKIEKKYKDDREKDMAKKETEKKTTTSKIKLPTGLEEIVSMKKQKAVANELDELIWQQEQKRVSREKGEKEPILQQPENNPITDLYKEHPERLEGISEDAIMKLAMLQSTGKSGSGGMNPLAMMMMMNQNQPSNIVELVTALKTLKEMSGEDNKSSGNNEMMTTMMMFLLQQNMQQAKQAPRHEKNDRDTLTTELIKLITKQSNLERQVIMDKMKDLEYRQTSDPLGEAKKMIDYMKTFKTLFGGALSSDGMKHEIDLKKLEYDHAKDQIKAQEVDKRMNQVGEYVEKAIQTVGKLVSTPAADKIKAGLESLKTKHQNDDSPELDLNDLPETDFALPPYPQEFEEEQPQTEKKKSRFRVHTNTDEQEY